MLICDAFPSDRRTTEIQSVALYRNAFRFSIRFEQSNLSRECGNIDDFLSKKLNLHCLRAVYGPQVTNDIVDYDRLLFLQDRMVKDEGSSFNLSFRL